MTFITVANPATSLSTSNSSTTSSSTSCIQQRRHPQQAEEVFQCSKTTWHGNVCTAQLFPSRFAPQPHCLPLQPANHALQTQGE
jgi:hypothetical protein